MKKIKCLLVVGENQTFQTVAMLFERNGLKFIVHRPLYNHYRADGSVQQMLDMYKISEYHTGRGVTRDFKLKRDAMAQLDQVFQIHGLDGYKKAMSKFAQINDA